MWEKIFVQPDWLHVRSNLVPGLTYDRFIEKNYLQACFYCKISRLLCYSLYSLCSTSQYRGIFYVFLWPYMVKWRNSRIIKVCIFTFGLKRSHTSTVKIVALLLKADESDDIKAAIITAIITPTNPMGRTFRTNLQQNNNNYISELKPFKNIQYFQEALFLFH